MRFPIALFPLLLAVSPCVPTPVQESNDMPIPQPEAIEFNANPEVDGLVLRLSNADPVVEQATPKAAALGQPLSAKETAALLARLPDVAAEPADVQDFAVRKGSLPAPRAGATVAMEMGAPTPPPVVATDGVLSVLRRSPVGEVPMAPSLSLTFSEPMIAVGTLAQTSKELPVTLEPQPAGAWRWIGTQTLLFEPDPRFPMATEYTVTVPAGTVAASGDKLAKEERFSFGTPALKVQSVQPAGRSEGLDPTLVLRFDQRIDPAALLPSVKLKSKQGEVPLRLATAEEIAKLKESMNLPSDEGTDRVLVLRPQAKLQRATDYTVVVAAKAPSAEGPRTTPSAQSSSFRTYGDFKLVRSQCDWGQSPCPPQSGWSIEMSNALDLKAFDPKSVRVEPAADLQVSSWGNTINIQGEKPGRKTYTVTLPAGLRDEFGQTPGKEVQVKFSVGAADPYIVGPPGPLLVLDPAVAPGISVATINHDSVKVEIYEAKLENWAKMSDWMNNRAWNDRSGPALKKLATRTVSVQRMPDERVETRISLAEWLPNNRGQLLVRLVPDHFDPDRGVEDLFYWVEATDIGIAAFVDGEDLVAWTSSLRDGRSLGGVSVSIWPDSAKATTDGDGLARIPLLADPKSPQILVAQSQDDLALLPAQVSWWYGGAIWQRYLPGKQLSWLIFDDRGLYKPGEKASVKGWIRQMDLNRGGDISGLDGVAEKVRWRVNDARGNEVAKGDSALSAAGGFHMEIALPDNMNLGTAQIYVDALNATGDSVGSSWHPLRVEEFRRPEFEVGLTLDSGPHLLGEHSIATVDAHYYTGGGLGAAPVTWQVSATPSDWRPPNNPDFNFGRYVPWWRWVDPGYTQVTGGDFASTTDASGQHRLRVEYWSLRPTRPMDIVAQASVADLNSQVWTATSRYVLHPAELYVGLKLDRSFVDAGTPIKIEALVVDLEGKARAGVAIDLKLTRSVWAQVDGEWKETEEAGGQCELVSSDGAVSCSVTPEKAGTWRLLATVTDAHGRANETELNLWVSGKDWTAPSSSLTQQSVEIVPSAQTFAAGDVAELLISAPFYPAEGALTLRRSGLVKVERFHMEGPTTTLRVPIEEAYVPNISAHVTLVGQTSRDDEGGKKPSRPAFAVGQIELKVPPLRRTLSVVVTPKDRVLAPGESTTLDLMVTGADGLPVADAELAVVVADEAILALTAYKLPDPLEIFYQARPDGVSDLHLRSYAVLDELAGQMGYGVGTGGGAADGALMNLGYVGDLEADEAPTTTMPAMPKAAPPAPGRGPMKAAESAERKPQEHSAPDDTAAGAPVAVRSDFSALALFAPEVHTDGAGHASVPLKLPDNLTRYRVMVIAVDNGKRFGSGEADLTARRTLMVRPSAPRFLNFGDHFELPVLIQNQGDTPLTVDVAARGSNLKVEPKLAGQRVVVPPNDRVELRFPASAESVGKARFQILASSGGMSDAAEGMLPVWTPATSEAFATYGHIDDGAVVQPIRRPEDVFSQFGGLEVSTSSTALQALTDAMLYLTRYPYECSEQMSSRVLAVVALRDVLTAFNVEDMPTPEEMNASVAEDIERLTKMQNWDGGWGFWRQGERSWPFLTIHVTHALVRAEAKGYAVPAQTRARALDYLQHIERHIPSMYSEESRRSIIAYALWVRHVAGDSDPREARALLKRFGGPQATPMEALGWLLPVLAKDGNSAELKPILTHINNNLVETAGAAHFVTSYSDGAEVLLHSDRRVDGILLDSLIEVQSANDVIPKLVKGLLDHRKQGRWGNTQENAFILLALDRYFRTYEATTPDFVARVWLGDHYVGEHAFHGRTTERAQIDVAMQSLLDGGPQSDLIVGKEGAGRLYYRVGLRYAPESLVLDPLDAGFTVVRRYEAIDNPSDVRQDADGTWHFARGARVRVRLSMVNSSRRYHVALVDPLPAGLEPLNPALATTGSLPEDPEASAKSDPWWWWTRVWYEHQNLRDERVEAFASLLWDGVHEYSYVARATTPGSFIVPPAKAEEMYAPETFGRTGTDRVVIE